MRIQLNDSIVNLPTSLSEITLGQRIDFEATHGRELDVMLKEIEALPDGVEKEIETGFLRLEHAFRAFAFFTGTDVEALKSSEYVDKIIMLYTSSLAVLFEDEANVELQSSFIWNNEVWELAAPTLKHGDEMTFGELIDGKQMVQNMANLSAGKWQTMLPICAIHLRKKGEPYQDEFLFEGSDRLKIMRELPMDIARQVAFFLSISLNMFLSTSQSSNQAAVHQPGTIASNTLKNSGGSTF